MGRRRSYFAWSFAGDSVAAWACTRGATQPDKALRGWFWYSKLEICYSKKSQKVSLRGSVFHIEARSNSLIRRKKIELASLAREMLNGEH